MPAVLTAGLTAGSAANWRIPANMACQVASSWAVSPTVSCPAQTFGFRTSRSLTPGQGTAYRIHRFHLVTPAGRACLA